MFVSLFLESLFKWVLAVNMSLKISTFKWLLIIPDCSSSKPMIPGGRLSTSSPFSGHLDVCVPRGCFAPSSTWGAMLGDRQSWGAALDSRSLRSCHGLEHEMESQPHSHARPGVQGSQVGIWYKGSNLTLGMSSVLKGFFDVWPCLVAGWLLRAKGRPTSSQVHAESKKDNISFQLIPNYPMIPAKPCVNPCQSLWSYG